MIRRLLAFPLAVAATLASPLLFLTLAAAPAAASEGGGPSISAPELGAALHSPQQEHCMPATRFTEVTADTGIAGDSILPIPVLGAVANGKYLEIEVPWDLEVQEVSARAAQVTNPADGDVTVDIQDDGASILAAPLSLAAANATAKQTGLSRVIARGSVLRIAFALTGTGPALQDVAVAVTGRRHFT